MKESSPRGSGSAAAKRSKTVAISAGASRPPDFLTFFAISAIPRLPLFPNSSPASGRALYSSDERPRPGAGAVRRAPHPPSKPEPARLRLADGAGGAGGLRLRRRISGDGRLADLRFLRRGMAAVLCLLPPQLPRRAAARAGQADTGAPHRRAPRSARAGPVLELPALLAAGRDGRSTRA